MAFILQRSVFVVNEHFDIFVTHVYNNRLRFFYHTSFSSSLHIHNYLYISGFSQVIRDKFLVTHT